mmetsp:Transcript_27470/g.60019  ORF Transcript_27470/g.60019 Transcript_27470/m.60019 type:complete len:268 (+) Transcript_27470:679-1482(+)
MLLSLRTPISSDVKSRAGPPPGTAPMLVAFVVPTCVPARPRSIPASRRSSTEACPAPDADAICGGPCGRSPEMATGPAAIVPGAMANCSEGGVALLDGPASISGRSIRSCACLRACSSAGSLGDVEGAAELASGGTLSPAGSLGAIAGCCRRCCGDLTVDTSCARSASKLLLCLPSNCDSSTCGPCSGNPLSSCCFIARCCCSCCCCCCCCRRCCCCCCCLCCCCCCCGLRLSVKYARSRSIDATLGRSRNSSAPSCWSSPLSVRNF